MKAFFLFSRKYNRDVTGHENHGKVIKKYVGQEKLENGCKISYFDQNIKNYPLVVIETPRRQKETNLIRFSELGGRRKNDQI